MKESDFLDLKSEIWSIIRKEGLVVTNQNLDKLLERAYKQKRDCPPSPPSPPTTGSNAIKPSIKIEVMVKGNSDANLNF